MTRIFLAAMALLIVSPVDALDVPLLRGRVTDLAHLLSSEEAAELDAKLAAYEEASGHQFAFLSVPTLGGASVEEYGVAVAHAWKLGDQKRDDGLVLLVAKQERKIRIEVGYGLEGVIPDAVAAGVIREVAAPAFKHGKWFDGAAAAFDSLASAARETSAPATPQSDGSIPKVPAQKEAVPGWLWLMLVISGAFAALVVWLTESDRRRRVRAYYGFDYDPRPAPPSVGTLVIRPQAPPIPSAASVTPSQLVLTHYRLDHEPHDAVTTREALADTSRATAFAKAGNGVAGATRQSTPRTWTSDEPTDSSDTSSSFFGGSDLSSSSERESKSDDSGFSGGGGDFGGGGASGDF